MTSGTAKARRFTARGAATRERIVSAAADLVWEKGAGMTSLDDVMEASGASKSQLYHYFADKDALLREAAELQTRRVLDTHGQLLELAQFARRLAPLAGRGPRAEQSGRLPFGRACLPIAAERQGRAKCRGAWARGVAKTDRGGTGQDEGARRTVERRQSCRHRTRCPGRRTGGSGAFEGRKVQLALGSSVRDGSRLRGGARSKSRSPNAGK